MKNYSDIKNTENSPILEALNRGSNNGVHTFGSVDDFISGLLGKNFITEKPDMQQNPHISHKEEPQENLERPQHIRMPNEFIINNNTEAHEDEKEEQEEENIEINSETSTSYKIYRDKEETFECNISVQGAKLSNSQVRLIFDNDLCNLIFYGKLYKDGKCAVSLKKMTFYPEGATGRVRLEVIVEDTIFVPWEETFIVEGAKKVKVEVKSQKRVDFRF